LYRYTPEKLQFMFKVYDVVGLCTLNQVDPCPITYILSNP
jgi:hypothetical protein